ncbi:ABC transporter ATP-binding protein [Marispirochaeta sp.]|uniref:ABC transporter ATP-binding protein n=1 Tax=Marispirochaeta sp. TaxID=2038653 RepID=UPI0029C8A675|nr:ABC transporter ATP-binding protein [Marispirochaeta sp.]
MIEAKGIVKNYRSGETIVHALRELNISIEGGEFTSIAGPSGSGKTTLLNLIGCIDTADSGEILIDKQKVSSLNKKELAGFRRENLGFIFQTFNLIPVLTAYENVAFSLHLLKLENGEVRERSMQILKEVGLEGMEDRRPGQLSGGQQQRVAVARALVKKPSIILADEPTANLDSETGHSVLELMKQMNHKHGTTFIFSTHDTMVMDFARRLVRLQDGRVVEDSGGDV